jgi:peptide chain release factor 2
LLKERTEHNDTVSRLAAASTHLNDALEYIELGEMESDESVEPDVLGEVSRATNIVEKMEFTRMLGGERDRSDAILTVNPGAGGVDSQDWAEMLLRMYTRFCERQGWKVELLDRQDADVAGIKSATFSIKGEYAYGMLRSEAGVHRLVRISPFDASARRHTAFAACFVFPDIESDVEVEIDESDLRIDTYRASGAGGQHVNKTNSAIRLTHHPTGVVVQCQAERSQHKNKARAMKMLKARLYDLEIQARNAERDEVEAGKQAINFGSQVRNYVMHPYRLVKDVRTNYETGNFDQVLDGDLEGFITAFLLSQPDA